jgi:hypothetical protein
VRRWWIVPVGFGLLALTLLIYSRRRDAERGQARAVASDALAAEFAALKRDVKKLQSEPRVVAVSAAQQQQAATEAESAAEDQPAAPAAAAELTPEQRMDSTASDLDARLASEHRDTAWSSEMTGQIRNAVSANAPAARLLESECAASLCRVVLAHDSLEDQKNASFALAAVPPFHAGVFYHYDRDPSTPKTSLYVLREGHSFREEAPRQR